MKKMFTADFETSTLEWFKIDKEARVWAYSLCEIGNTSNFLYGNSIDDFMNFCMDKKTNYTLWFHNLKFDGEYIFNWLLKNDYECIKEKSERHNKTFMCLLSDTGQFYSIEIYFEVNNKKVNKVTIYDSLKILNFSVEKIAQDFNLPIRKLELDYDTYRKKGHILTFHEIDYIRNDVEIMARALEIMFGKDLKKITIGSDALYNYKKTISRFEFYFPMLGDKDELIRKSYRGGWTYLNPLYKEKQVKKGIVIDKNSMYPSVMYYCDLPFGEPVYFEGEYQKDLCYPLYIQVMSCSFSIKEHKLPTIQLKHTMGYMENEYIETTDGKIETLCLTSVDMKLFKEHYNIDDVTYICGFKFKQIKGLFKNYIDEWSGNKIKAKHDGNGAMYTISKLMLNSLYGKFGLNPSVRGKYPYLKSDGSVGYSMYAREERDSIYVPLASFVTAYARYDIINNSQAIRDYTLEKYRKDYYIYSDTDSIHCLYLSDEELSKIMDIDDYRLGAYKKESEFKEASFIRQKCYIEVDYDGNVHSTIAGMPKKLSKYVNLSNFKRGFTIPANDVSYEDKKLTYAHVNGGVLLAPIDFTIK